MEKIALLPGGFKPPHAGHYNMAKWLAANTDVNSIIIKVGSKVRDGISREMSLQLWNLYRTSDKDPIAKKISVLASDSPSPVRDVYDFIEKEAPEGSKIYLGLGEKDVNDKRYANIGKFAKPRSIEFETILVPPQAGGISGTEMRGFIKDNDKVSFFNSLPNHLSSEQKSDAWDIVYAATSKQEKPIDPRALSMQLEEDLYNPKDKVNDYMRSSEYKAGYSKPDDIDPAYKYSRGGTYTHGGMYEEEKKGKILHVYDFDDTITQVKSNIKTTITKPNDPNFFKELNIPSEEFPEKSKELENKLKGYNITYDFKEFEKQIGDAIVNTGVVNKLKKSLSNPNIKTTILTARSIGHPVTRYLKQELGLDAYVVPLGMQVDGNVKGVHKAAWIEKHIQKGYSNIFFIDDSEDNRIAVSALKDKYPDIKLKVENPKEVGEAMMGMMTEPEKKKHAKNLKRLKKDLGKQGDQYMEVPNYLKGTLTRKMYEGDTYEKMAAKGKKAGNLKQGTVRKRLRIKDGEKIPLSRITKAISSLKKRKSLNDKNKKYLKALNLAKTLKTTTNVKEAIVGDSIVCDNCGWSWKIKDGGDDLFICHKCNHNNTPLDENYPPYKADQVQKVRYQASDTFTNSPKQAKKRGYLQEKDPKKGTGKKPKGSGRRLYTDENPKDTVSVKFSTRQDIVDTLNKTSFKSKPHKRQSQIINLIHQRVRAALSKAKDPAVKKRLKSGFEYIKKRKEASKKKTQQMKKENVFTKDWWKEIINEILTEGGAAGHMAHPFNLPNVNSGRDLLDIFKKSADSLNKKPGAIKIDGVNASIRLVDIEGKKQFVMDRGSKQALDIKGITKTDLEDRFKTKDGSPHGMVKTGGEVLDMFNSALPNIKSDLEKLGAYDDPNILFNMEYVSGKTNVQDYSANFIAIHGLNKIGMVDEPSEKTGKMLSRRKSKEVSYDKSALQSLLANLKPIAKKRGYEVYGSVPTTMKKKPNFNSALSKNYTVNAGESSETKSLGQWLNNLNDIPEKDLIGINVGYKAGSSTVNNKKVGAVSKQVYLSILNGENIDGLFDNAEDRKKAIQGFVTYLATEKLGDEVLKVLDSPMGSADNHEGVVIRDKNIANVPFKITGKFILGGMQTGFR